MYRAENIMRNDTLWLVKQIEQFLLLSFQTNCQHPKNPGNSAYLESNWTFISFLMINSWDREKFDFWWITDVNHKLPKKLSSVLQTVIAEVYLI